MKLRKGILWIGLILLIGVLGGRWIWGSRDTLAVEVDTVRRHTIIPFITESAVIRPVVEVPISPDVSGEVVRIYVKEGDTVRAGQVLFTIRPDNYQTALMQMQAALEEAKAQYAAAQAALAQQRASFLQDSLAFVRAQKLYEKQAIAEADWDAARIRYQVAQAQLRSAESNVQAAYYRIRSTEANLRRAQIDYQRTSVYASMDGVVTRLLVRTGQRVVGVGQMAGTESVRIADLSRFLVEVQITESDVVRLHVGDSASVEVQAYPGVYFVGRVQEIGYSSGKAATQDASALGGEQVSTYLVRIAIDTARYDRKKYPLRPEMSAVVRIFYTRRDAVVAVPLQAVAVRGQKEVVYEVEGGSVVRERPVKTGVADDQQIEVTEGLQEGRVIVVGPYDVLQEKLRDSVRIKPLPKKE
ncbi:MAG: efflux RND transporter periplasmic adaptor subunit [Bacteroidia bacterium]|jgi:HlyD family secretion protein|nr:efflux RND transporter periplasmic adaptor subunit [Bacteroidia bacterium]